MLLTEKNPLKTPYVFGGLSFFIDMSFNNILTVFEVLDDKELNEVDRAKLVMFILTDDQMFEDDEFMTTEEDIEFAEGFLEAVFNELIVDKGEEVVQTDVLGNPLPVKNEEKKKTFDFVHDAAYIFASFMQAYNMNLHEQHNKLHWEVFLALFNGLPSETIMMKIIDIRERPIPTGKGSKEQAKELREAKERFALPDTELDEEEWLKENQKESR